MKPSYVRVDHWSIVRESGDTLLRGVMYGHPNFKDGRSAVSNPITSLNEGLRLAKDAQGNIYRLGRVDERYAASIQTRKTVYERLALNAAPV